MCTWSVRIDIILFSEMELKTNWIYGPCKYHLKCIYMDFQDALH